MAGGQVLCRKDPDLFIAVGRGGVQGRQRLQPPRDEPAFLLQLPAAALFWGFTGVALPGRDLQCFAAHAAAILPYHQQPTVFIHRHNADPTGVPNDLTLGSPAVFQLHLPALVGEHPIFPQRFPL